jgi:hypothetical protein
MKTPEEKIESLKSYLKFLISPQDDAEQILFAENKLVDAHIDIMNRIDSMTPRELIDEINIQIEYKGDCINEDDYQDILKEK